MPALVDIELPSCADFCVRENDDGTYTIELDTAAEVIDEQTLLGIVQQLTEMLRRKGAM